MKNRPSFVRAEAIRRRGALADLRVPAIERPDSHGKGEIERSLAREQLEFLVGDATHTHST
jgi:hypothetical protein